MQKITEQESKYNHLDKMDTSTLLKLINKEDKTIPLAIEKVLPRIEKTVNLVHEKLSNNGRLFYVGAGTSGRLGVLDASECPPTFGVGHNLVIGIIAGGDSAIRKAVEFAEDDKLQAWKDLQNFNISNQDIVIGIAASGTTPYVIGALKKCQEQQISTACIVCNKNSPIAKYSDIAIECIVGPEFVTGSSRMKAGTAQKLILNMITTSVMIKLGRVKDNKMIDMQLSNNKLVARGIKMIQEEINVSKEKASKLLKQFGSVRKAVDNFKPN